MENNRSYLGSITKYEKIGEGSFSNVYKCDYFDEMFAYKEFKDQNYVEFIKDRMNKLTQFYNDIRITFPYKLIYKNPNDSIFQGYIMDNKYDFYKLTLFKDLNYDEKISVLKKARVLIEILHKEYNIIHTDLNPWNILYNSNKNKVTLIDFDTFIDLKDKKGYQEGYYNFFCDEYIKHFGIEKDLDIFLFNLCCYSFINNIEYFSVLNAINNNYYGKINDNKAIDLFKSYKDLECKKSLKKEYIIDYL